MPPPPAAKPELNAWIGDQRRARGWRVEELSARLQDLGVRAQPNTIRVWEGRKPNPPRPETIEVLERLFGAPAPVDRDPVTDARAVIAAIDRQTAVLERIAVALERLVDRA